MKENNNLINEIKNGNKKALNDLIKRNLKLIKYVAKDYLGRGVEFDDLIQEGAIGLCKAVYRFDPTRNTKFTSYATYWIKKSIFEAIQKNSRIIYLPKHIDEMLVNLKYSINELSVKLNRYPTLSEIIEKTGLSMQQIVILYPHLFPSASINQNIDYVLQDVGLTEDGMIMQDLIISEDLTFDEQIENKEKRRLLLELLETSNLSEKSKAILKLRYGFYNNVIYKYVEIAKMLGVTSEAIRSCEKSAIEKMKRNKLFVELAIHLDKPESEIEKIKNNIKSQKRKIK